MTDIRPLLLMQKEYGGSVSPGTPPKNRNARPSASYTIVTHNAMAFLKRVRPWLIIKAEQADIAIEFQDGLYRETSQKLPEAEILRRERLRREITEAKYRHLDPADFRMGANSGDNQNGQSRAKQEPQAPGVCND